MSLRNVLKKTRSRAHAQQPAPAPSSRVRSQSTASTGVPPTSPTSHSHRHLHLHLHRTPATSANLPPLCPSTLETDWHSRARALAQHTPPLPPLLPLPPSSPASSQTADEQLQEAITSHERGDLSSAAEQFRALADRRGVALAMVLYGLCLRHGWGLAVDHSLALGYLRRAARASLGDGDGGGGKDGEGELVLAIFEIGNCYRYGWGVAKDLVAAREHYLTAAELGDGDAMNEVAWCFLEGVGGGKDKVRAAGFYRRAEAAGCAIVGNTWIHKDKYMKESKG